MYIWCKFGPNPCNACIFIAFTRKHYIQTRMTTIPLRPRGKNRQLFMVGLKERKRRRLCWGGWEISSQKRIVTETWNFAETIWMVTITIVSAKFPCLSVFIVDWRNEFFTNYFHALKESLNDLSFFDGTQKILCGKLCEKYSLLPLGVIYKVRK